MALLLIPTNADSPLTRPEPRCGSGRTCKAPHPDYTERRVVTDHDAEGTPILHIRVTPSVVCARLAGHDGDHAGYVFRILSPETWPKTRGQQP